MSKLNKLFSKKKAPAPVIQIPETDKIRAVLIGTGNVGAVSARLLQGRGDIELVGCWAHKETAGHLIGTDPGLIDGDEPWGIQITGDEEEIWALKPDVAIICINIVGLRMDSLLGEWFVKCLERGINVVTTSHTGLISPDTYKNQKFIKKIREACEAGNSTIYVNGEDPGFSETLAATLTSCSKTIKSVKITEIFNYSPVTSRSQMEDLFGFGNPANKKCMMQLPGVLTMGWGSSIQFIAKKLGVQLEDINEYYEKVLTDKDLTVGYGTIKAGTVGAVKLRIAGVVNGKEAIIVEHVNRMSDDIAPEWEQAKVDGTIRIEVEGMPNMSCEFVMGTDKFPEEHSYEGYNLTAGRIINAIPHVVKAPAGIVTAAELPLYQPVNAFRDDSIKVEHKLLK